MNYKSDGKKMIYKPKWKQTFLNPVENAFSHNQLASVASFCSVLITENFVAVSNYQMFFQRWAL